jgi:PAS domain S-box-containing protein
MKRMAEAAAADASEGADEMLGLGRRAARLGRVLCLIGAAVGAMGLFGWITGLSHLTTLIPGHPNMKANTALSLLLLGLAGILRHQEVAPRAARVVASASGLVALVIGLGTMIEHATGRDLGIDQWLFEAGAGPYPGRPVPLVALALALLAGASLLFDNRRRSRVRPSEVMILGAGLIAFAAIIGAAFGAGPLYRLRTAPTTGVPVPSALGLLLISAGMFLERPAAGLAQLATSSGPGGALLRRLVLPGIALPVLLAFGLSRAFTLFGIRDVALLFATLVASTTVGGLVLVVSSAAPLDRAHKALAATRAQTRELLQQAPDGIFVADLEGRYTDVNRAGCEMLGYSREEILGKTILDLIPPEDVARLAASKQRLLAGKAEISEWRLLRKDATQLPVELHAKILPDGRWQAFVRDISDRKRIEDERQVFVSLLDNSSDFIGIADPNGKPIYLNPAGRRMVGFPADLPIENAQILDCYAAEERTFAVDVILKTMVEQGRWSGETHFRHWQTEKAIPVSDEHFIIRDPSGERVLGMGTVTRDISDRKRVEEEQRFLAEAGAVLASSLDYEQTLTTVGRLVVRDFADWCTVDLIEDKTGPRRLKVISARASEASLAARFEQLPLDRRLPHLARPVLDTGRSFLVECMTPGKLESFAQSEEHLRILREIDPRSILGLPLIVRGELLGVLVLISTRPSHTYKSTDLRLGEALAERAALAIENGRLYQKALQATGLRDDVLGIVAHDLRNPVAAITMAATELRRKGPQGDPRNARLVESVIRTAGRMNRLIGDLLDVSLIEAGQFGVEGARVSTRQLLTDLAEAQRLLAASASVDLRLELADGLPDVWGDQHRLLQVLENLLSNAIKFTPAQGRITIGAAPRAREVLFWVADTGCGISSDGLPHVFNPFWQAHKGAHQGAGLGLPITRGIIEAHGGRIWVESTLGRGSAFYFTLPAAADAEERPSETMH